MTMQANEQPKTRQQAAARLQQVHAEIYQCIISREALEKEAISLAGYLNGSDVEDMEKAKAAEETAPDKPAEQQEQQERQPADHSADKAGE